MPSPDRFISTYANDNGARVWTVIGYGGSPEMAPSVVPNDAASVFSRHDKRARADIPVWDGIAASWTTFGAVAT